MDPLRFPIGLFEIPDQISDVLFKRWIEDLASFPTQVQHLTDGLSPLELALTYRPGGWNIRQVVHHCADSHVNSIVRFKLALTEEEPTIRPYREDLWAELEDGREEDLRNSLSLLHGLHGRWVSLLKSLSEEQLNRRLIHPDFAEPWTIRSYVGNYAWHCRHHLAHIRLALNISPNE